MNDVVVMYSDGFIKEFKNISTTRVINNTLELHSSSIDTKTVVYIPLESIRYYQSTEKSESEEMKKSLAQLFNRFQYTNGNHIMYFTDEECDILADYIVSQLHRNQDESESAKTNSSSSS